MSSPVSETINMKIITKQANKKTHNNNNKETQQQKKTKPKKPQTTKLVDNIFPLYLLSLHLWVISNLNSISATYGHGSLT